MPTELTAEQAAAVLRELAAVHPSNPKRHEACEWGATAIEQNQLIHGEIDDCGQTVAKLREALSERESAVASLRHACDEHRTTIAQLEGDRDLALRARQQIDYDHEAARSTMVRALGMSPASTWAELASHAGELASRPAQSTLELNAPLSSSWQAEIRRATGVNLPLGCSPKEGAKRIAEWMPGAAATQAYREDGEPLLDCLKRITRERDAALSERNVARDAVSQLHEMVARASPDAAAQRIAALEGQNETLLGRVADLEAKVKEDAIVVANCDCGTCSVQHAQGKANAERAETVTQLGVAVAERDAARAEVSRLTSTAANLIPVGFNAGPQTQAERDEALRQVTVARAEVARLERERHDLVSGRDRDWIVALRTTLQITLEVDFGPEAAARMIAAWHTSPLYYIADAACISRHEPNLVVAICQRLQQMTGEIDNLRAAVPPVGYEALVEQNAALLGDISMLDEQCDAAKARVAALEVRLAEHADLPRGTVLCTEVKAPCDLRHVERVRLPDDRDGKTLKLRIGDREELCETCGAPLPNSGVSGHLTLNRYPDGRAGEMFLALDRARRGDLAATFGHQLAIAISIGLQHGVPLATFASRMRHVRDESGGIAMHEVNGKVVPCENPRTVGSLVDLIAVKMVQFEGGQS